jgi:hypothetical protein
MTTVLTIIVPTLLAALIGLGAYLYKNRIGFSVTTISGRVPDDNLDLKMLANYGQVHAERLLIKNFGLRTLEGVELYFRLASLPVSLTINDPTTLSTKSIQTTWSDGALQISIPNLPSGEEVKLELLRVGHYEINTDRLRGSGGKYKIVDLERHKANRALVFGLMPLAVFGAISVLSIFLR